jgi:hypothetical protein
MRNASPHDIAQARARAEAAKLELDNARAEAKAAQEERDVAIADLAAHRERAIARQFSSLLPEVFRTSWGTRLVLASLTIVCGATTVVTSILGIVVLPSILAIMSVVLLVALMVSRAEVP